LSLLKEIGKGLKLIRQNNKVVEEVDNNQTTNEISNSNTGTGGGKNKRHRNK